MIKNQHIVSALPLIAAVLGHKYGIQVRIGGDRAYTDGRIIQLPSLPVDGDENLLNLARGFIDHESAHIRATDFELIKRSALTPLEKHLWNILEDFSVEHKLAESFPGCGHNFNWLIRHLFGKKNTNKDPGQSTPSGAQILNWFLLKVRSLDVPDLQEILDWEAVEVERAFPGLLPRLNAALQDVPSVCRSTSDCLSKARELLEIISQYRREQQQNPEAVASSAIDANSSINPAEALGQLLKIVEADLPKDLSTVLADALVDLHSDAQPGEPQITIAIPTTKSQWDLIKEQLIASRQTTIALRTRLQGLLQSLTLKCSRPSYAGKLDTKSLHKLMTADARVFRRRQQHAGLNTAVHILLDTSGSMRGNPLELAYQGCYALASALILLPGVKVAVTAFPGQKMSTENGEICQTVAPILEPQQKMHTRFALDAEGGTPLDAALWWVIGQMQRMQEKRKLILVITDGEPDSIEAAKTALAAAEHQGLEVYGLGLGDHSILKILPHNSRIIQDLPDLTSALFKLLQNALLKNIAC